MAWQATGAGELFLVSRCYQVAETGGGGADGGIDLVFTKPGKSGGNKLLVQANSGAPTRPAWMVRELYGVMGRQGCPRRVRDDIGAVHR